MPPRSASAKLLRSFVAAIVAALAASFVLTVTYIAIASVPTRELDHEELQALYGDHPRYTSVKLDPKWRRIVRRAQVDYFLHPVADLPGYFVIHLIGAHRLGDDIFLEFAPNTFDTYVLYQCATDGKLMSRAYVYDSP